MTTAFTASPVCSLAKGLFFDLVSELSSASVMWILPVSAAQDYFSGEHKVTHVAPAAGMDAAGISMLLYTASQCSQTTHFTILEQ